MCIKVERILPMALPDKGPKVTSCVTMPGYNRSMMADGCDATPVAYFACYLLKRA